MPETYEHLEKRCNNAIQQRDALRETIQNALVSTKLMTLPRLDNTVASNEEILSIMVKSFEAALQK